MTKKDDSALRYVMALYYAFGRKDAGSKADPNEFAAHYQAMFDDTVSGAASFCPSVQDAFGYFESRA